MRSTSGTLSTGLLSTGEQRDVESAMYYLRARYYDPASGLPRLTLSLATPTGLTGDFTPSNSARRRF